MGRIMLTSLDLFSGIGGMTHALRGLCRPVGYCDSDDSSIRVLESNMARRLLPRAPICDDVRHVTSAWFRRNRVVRPDIVVGGFPCVGFSPLGRRLGVKNPETGLFFEIMRILDITRSPFVFLENVPNLLTLGMDVVTRELGARSYELRWCVVSASQVGAPHERRRWFCLGVKRRAILALPTSSSYDRFHWHGQGPGRTVRTDSSRARERAALLGNSVVPDAVRRAFVFLLARCDDSRVGFVPAVRAKKKKRRDRYRYSYPACGVVRTDGVVEDHAAPAPSVSRKKQLTLVFDPRRFRSRKPASPLLTSRLVTSRVHARSWATPRHGMLRACNYLTTRSIRDLPTQVRFERGSLHPAGGVSPEFVEWLMGYPRGWTRTYASSSRS